MKQALSRVLALAIGSFLFQLMTDQDYAEAAQNAYFMAFGGMFIYFTMARDKSCN